MRTALLFSVVIFTACGGTWSNTDIVFTSALPRAADLQAVIPTSSSTQPLTGVSTRRDPLNVGDASNAYAQSKKAATDYNATLVALLGLLDQIRVTAPTTRTAHSRVWGPFDDANNRGRLLNVEISNSEEAPGRFEWKIESKAITDADSITMLEGTFTAATTAKVGTGTIAVHVQRFRDVVAVDENFKRINEITMTYATDVDPRDVEMKFALVPGNSTGVDAFSYVSREHTDGDGAIAFLYVTPGPEVTQLQVSSAWLKSGAGRADSVVLAGTYTGAMITECWNDSFAVSFYRESWVGGQTSGTETSCVNVDGI